MLAGQRSRYSDWLRAGRAGDRIPVGARISTPVQNGPGGHPVSCILGTVHFPGVKSSRAVTLTPHPLLVSWSIKSRATPLLLYGPYGLYRASVSVQGCTLPFFNLFSIFPFTKLQGVRWVEHLVRCYMSA